MANKYTAYPVPPKEDLECLYFEKQMTQVEIADHYGKTQKMVFSWFKKHKIKSRIARKRNQIGESNHSWKGNKATYAAFHYRVEAVRGKPHYCSACGTLNATRYEWANLTGKYEDLNDYARMCIKCHRAYDKKRPNSSKHVRRKAK